MGAIASNRVVPVTGPSDASDRSGRTVEGNDGVCFTSGPEAAVIGAGTIHAYLAARRRPPQVVAGISMGALNAAAMQRAYREQNGSDAPTEAVRWSWFRRYVDGLSDRPFSAVWNAIPDQSDFFADMIPIRDASVPSDLEGPETAARRRQYLLVKLGRWLAQLPVSVRLVAAILVHYVRLRERYPVGQRVMSAVALLGSGVNCLTRIVLHACLSPQFFPEHKLPAGAGEDEPAAPIQHRCPVPAAAWLNTVSQTLMLMLIVLVAVAAYIADPAEDWQEASKRLWRFSPLVLLVIAGVVAAARFCRALLRWRPVQRLAFPLLGVAACAYTLANALLLGALLGGSIRLLYLYAFHRWDSWLATAIMPAFGLYLLVNWGFLPLALLPETRRWLIARRFLVPWPRPLVGWATFLFLWIHVLSLGTFVVLGLFFLKHVVPLNDGVVRSGVVATVSVGWLFAVPTIPLLPVALPIALAPRMMKRLAAARAGWRKVFAWTLSLATSATMLICAIWLWYLLFGAFRKLFESRDLQPWVTHRAAWGLFEFATFWLTLTWLVMGTVLIQPVFRRWLTERLLRKLGLDRSLIHDFHLRRQLLSLFGPSQIGDDPMPAVLVAAPLQTLSDRGSPKLASQLWAKPRTPLLHALRAALAVPPLLAPLRIKGEQLDWWLKDSVRTDPANDRLFARGIDLVDGSVIRHNPLPALYGFLRESPRARPMARNNDRDHPAVHVVYGVPIEGRPWPPPNPSVNGKGVAGQTIVDVGLTSLRLSQRRDTQLEVIQTNLISRLESVVPESASGGETVTHAIFADEIAPRETLAFGNPLDPAPGEILQGIATGCRRSLETLYRLDLARFADAEATDAGRVPCKAFLSSIGKLPNAPGVDVPGLPEVCERCTGHLGRPEPLTPARRSSVSVDTMLSEPARLCGEHPQLTGEAPRIVFVASGGVFRGAFHVGLLAALQSCGIKPDLIVGASVGTLMGGALGAMFAPGQKDVLARLVDAFLRVDEVVALTRTLKSAARELGIRGRSIRLSPRDVRRMVRRGSRRDPGFAATGAPSALIDAMSDLFLIPQRETREIAAEFIAGHVAQAVHRFIGQLRTETIKRLDVEEAVLGASLLEGVAVGLLTDGSGERRLQRQPFQLGSQIAYYGATTNLVTHSALLLGGNGVHRDAPFDFVEAVLASSAFPVVFAPRRASRVFPGTGRADVFYADGGMFDNLPFLPAIEILSRAQRGYRTTRGKHRTRLDFLEQRLAKPDLVIAGALNALAEDEKGEDCPCDSVGAIRRRAGSLQHNVKIGGFRLAAQRVYGQLQRLRSAAPAWLHQTSPHFVDDVVNAAVLPVFPASAEHLNGTFAFCASTGLNRRRVQKSIADGCYQTLLALAVEQQRAATRAEDVEAAPQLLVAKSVRALGSRIPALTRVPDPPGSRDECPYFRKDGRAFACPFAAPPAAGVSERASMRGIFRACGADPDHWGEARGLEAKARGSRLPAT